MKLFPSQHLFLQLSRKIQLKRRLFFPIKVFFLFTVILMITTSFHSTNEVDHQRLNSSRDSKSTRTTAQYFGSWESMDGGVTLGSVHTLATDNHGNLFVGGSFHKAGGENREKVAKWVQGSYWANNFSADFDKFVFDLVIDNNDQIFATGNFEEFEPSGEELNHVAATTTAGPFWHSLGSGLANYGDVLMTDVFGRTYVGGSFSLADGQLCHGLVRWIDDHWENFEPSMYFDIFGMASNKNGVFYGAGDFSNSPLTFEVDDGVVKYDGEHWVNLGEADHIIEDLALDTAGNVIIVGAFSHVEDIQAYHMAKWNGEFWQGIDVPAYHKPRQLIVDGDNNIYIGGVKPDDNGYWDGFVARWTGLYWEQLGETFNLSTTALAIDTFGNLYVGGEFDNNGLNHIAKFSEQVTPFPAFAPQVLVQNEELDLANEIKVFPNPANELLNIKASDNLSDIVFFDITGKEVLNQINPGSEIDISHLAPGIYFIQIEQKEKSTVMKIVVE